MSGITWEACGSGGFNKGKQEMHVLTKHMLAGLRVNGDLALNL